MISVPPSKRVCAVHTRVFQLTLSADSIFYGYIEQRYPWLATEAVHEEEKQGRNKVKSNAELQRRPSKHPINVHFAHVCLYILYQKIATVTSHS